MESEIKFCWCGCGNSPGLCHCGCGLPTQIATENRPKRGYVKGQPKLFYLGHHRGKSPLPLPPNPSGMCKCGCGSPAPIAHRNNRRAGYVKGYAIRFLPGHQFATPEARARNSTPEVIARRTSHAKGNKYAAGGWLGEGVSARNEILSGYKRSARKRGLVW